MRAGSRWWLNQGLLLNQCEGLLARYIGWRNTVTGGITLGGLLAIDLEVSDISVDRIPTAIGRRLRG